MSTQHVSWGSIELLHNAIRTLTLLNEQGRPFPVIEYRAKVKLHGTNCAVQIADAGPVAQSRNLILTPADHKGFATRARRLLVDAREGPRRVRRVVWSRRRERHGDLARSDEVVRRVRNSPEGG
jgi:hypothetical protein